jgi:alkylhydroperoxidase family enzyme
VARLPYVDPAAAPEPVREALEAVPPLNLFRMAAHAPSALRPLLRLGGALLGEAELDARLRELAILRVASLSRAEYEWIQHVAIAEAVGVRAEQIAAVQAGETGADCLDEAERLVLAFTTEVVRDVGASQATFDRAAALLSPREIVELTLTVGYYMMVARLMETTQLDLDPPLGVDVVDSARRGRRAG